MLRGGLSMGAFLGPAAVLIFVSSVLSQETTAGKNEPLRHSVIMDKDKNFIFSWTPHETYGIFEMTVKTLGYVALGFSPSGAMKGSDIIMAWLDEKGEIQISDRFADSNASPVLDDVQNVDLEFGFRNDSHTVVRFRKEWNTCDKAHDFKISKNGNTRVIYAWHKETPSPGSSKLPYHLTNRGSRTMYLREPVRSSHIRETDVITWDVVGRNVTVPPIATYYHCSIHKAPPLDKKHHVIAYRPLVQPGHELNVHHVLVYECELENASRFLDHWVDHSGSQCYMRNMPLSWKSCAKQTMGAWAIGGTGVYTPPEAGIPLREEFGGSTYFLMETHYDNPTKKEGMVDNSGLQFFLTPTLRPNDMGTIRFGHNVDPVMMVPPGAKDWVISGQCPKECTQKILPKEGINIFSGFLHSHLFGTGLTVRHIRDGKELPPILQDLNYDFNFQQERILKEPRLVLPGDHILLNCNYDTTKTNKTIFGGISTSEEMCFSYFNYYPRQKSLHCDSSFDLISLTELWGLKLYGQNLMSSPSQRIAEKRKLEELIDVEEEKKLMAQMKTTEATPKDIYMFKLLFLLKVESPLALQNQSLLGLIMSNHIWKMPGVLAKTQEFYRTGQYLPECPVEDDSLDGKLFGNPEFEPYVPEPDATCAAPKS